MNDIWNPIATAPKLDTTGEPVLFLGFVPHSCGGYMCVFYWNDKLHQFQNNIDGGVDKPTHWKHLPQKP